jgi:hypothetical protein
LLLVLEKLGILALLGRLVCEEFASSCATLSDEVEEAPKRAKEDEAEDRACDSNLCSR